MVPEISCTAVLVELLSAPTISLNFKCCHCEIVVEVCQAILCRQYFKHSYKIPDNNNINININLTWKQQNYFLLRHRTWRYDGSNPTSCSRYPLRNLIVRMSWSRSSWFNLALQANFSLIFKNRLRQLRTTCFGSRLTFAS